MMVISSPIEGQAKAKAKAKSEASRGPKRGRAQIELVASRAEIGGPKRQGGNRRAAPRPETIGQKLNGRETLRSQHLAGRRARREAPFD